MAGITETRPITLHVRDRDGFYSRGEPSGPGSHEIEFNWHEVEEWRPIPSHPDYEASDAGRIRRATPGKGTRVGKILATPDDSGGYPTIGTTARPLRVHVLVAEAFHGRIPAGGEVHHRNEDRGDPRPGNLEIKPSKLAHGEEHRAKHPERRRHGEANPTVACACGCGATFPKFAPDGRPRRYVQWHATRRQEVMG